jgi:hypothetical protein
MPRIEMTPTARFALFFLRVYLIVLLGLITLKFVRSFSSSPASNQPRAAAAQSVQAGDSHISPK